MTNEVRDTTVASVVLEAGAACPDRVAIQCRGAALTYRELVGLAAGFAGFLRGAGVCRGDRVGLWLPNGLAWVAAHIATAFVDGVTVPISTRSTAEEAAFVIAHSRSRVVVAANDFLGRNYADESRDGLTPAAAARTTIVGATWNAPDLPVGRSVNAPACEPDHAAVVQYTSGTTGRPKGCVLSHRAWTNNARISAELSGVSSAGIVFTPSPFFHLFGSLTALMGALSAKATLVTTPTFDVEDTLASIQAAQADQMVAVPTVWLDLLASGKARQLRSLQGGVWGGGPFPTKDLERALSPEGAGWNLNAIYGMTEAPTLTQVRRDDPLFAKVGTVGRATPGVELRIADPESNDPVPHGATGEVRARGYNRMIGYLDDEQSTSDKFLDGWIRTGDLGAVDEHGFLRIVGRITDMVVTGGANVYASEVEDVIHKMTEIALVAIVARPHQRLGEVPVAYITTRGKARLTEEDVIAFCHARLARYKVPHSVILLDEMPLTASGKIEKVRLNALTEGEC